MTPLVGVGCNMVTVSRLSDGSPWDRRTFPGTIILETRPRKKLKQTKEEGKSSGLLSLTSARIDIWHQQGYEDAMPAMEHIRKPLEAR